MAYRSDVEALQARHTALDAEIIEKSRARDDVARMLAEARAREASDAYVADLAAGGPARRRRHRIRIALAALVSMLAIVGIGVGYRMSVGPRPSELEIAYHQFSLFTDEMCACRDTACASRVSDEMTKWSVQMAKQQRTPPRMTEGDTKRFTELGERMGKCMQAAMTIPDHPSNQNPPLRPID
jgi:hypothetical protein